MEEKEKSFVLNPYLTPENRFEIKDFEENKQIVVDYLASKAFIGVIEDDNTNKRVKADRTEIRKKLDAVKEARISITKLFMGKFDEQLKEIEKIIDEADKALKVHVDAYALAKKVNEPAKPKILTLTIQGYDEKAITKIREAAIKAGLSAELK